LLATVAYYHRFEALEAQCKSEINADDLRDACRLVNRERLHDPLQTLQNPRNLGLLDRPGRSVFSINSVGENLIAMTLPSDGNMNEIDEALYAATREAQLLRERTKKNHTKQVQGSERDIIRATALAWVNNPRKKLLVVLSADGFSAVDALLSAGHANKSPTSTGLRKPKDNVAGHVEALETGV
jgi:hypothetical protein